MSGLTRRVCALGLRFQLSQVRVRHGSRDTVPDRLAIGMNGPRIKLVVCLSLMGAGVALYWPSLAYDFVNFDDHGYVLENTHLVGGFSPESIGWVLRPHAANWIPLTWLSFVVDYEIAGLDPGIYHRTNVLLHAIASALLFLALNSLTRSLWRSAFVAAVFALHPTHVESVAWIAERKDVLSGVFFMCSLWAYSHYARRAFSPGRYALVAGSMGLGLLSKSSLVTLPAIFLLLDAWPLGRLRAEWRRVVLEKLPLLAMAAGAGWMTLRAARESEVRFRVAELSFAERLAHAPSFYAKYMALSLWPTDLAVLYPHPGHDISWGLAALGGVMLLGLSFFALVCAKRQPAVALGWFWFIGTLLPVIGLVGVGYHGIADRFLYIPLIGLTIALAWGMPTRWFASRGRRAALAAGVAVVLLVMALMSRVQLPVWQNSESLFSHALEVTEDNAIVHNALARELLRQQRDEESIEHFQAAHRIYPDWGSPPVSLGRLMLASGDVAGARQQFQLALSLEPGWSTALIEMARIHLIEDHPGRAIALLEQLIEGAEGLERATVLALLATAHEYAGNARSAIRRYREALALRPDLALSHARLGVLLARRGKGMAASKHLRRAEELGLPDPELRFEVAGVFFELAEDDAAIAVLRSLVAEEPDQTPVLNNLAWYLATHHDPALRDPSEALRLAQRAARLTSRRDAEVLDTLAAALAANGQIKRAIHVLDEAIALVGAQHERVEVLRATQRRYRGQLQRAADPDVRVSPPR